MSSSQTGWKRVPPAISSGRCEQPPAAFGGSPPHEGGTNVCPANPNKRSFMPIFEYICKDCNHPFEKIVPRYDSTVECTHCNSTKVEKQLSVFAVAGSSSSSEVSDA